MTFLCQPWEAQQEGHGNRLVMSAMSSKVAEWVCMPGSCHPLDRFCNFMTVLEKNEMIHVNLFKILSEMKM